MQFVKAHWISLACGLAALVGIVLAVLGMTRDNVVQEMKKQAALAQQMSTLRSGAQNSETIDAEKARGKKFEDEYENVVRTAETINERQPLMEGVFPEPAQADVPYRFREAYRRRLWELPHALKAGSLPNEDEVRDEAELMADLARRKAEQEGDVPEVAAAPTGMPGASPGGGGRVAPPGGGGRVAPPSGLTAGGKGAPPVGGGRVGPAAGARLAPQPGPAAGAKGGGRTAPQIAAPTPEGAGAPAARTAAPQLSGAQAEEARYRAAVKKARTIRVYALGDRPENSPLHVSPIILSEEEPKKADMWYAQVSLWVQEDLVNAIARLNDEVAQQVGAKEASVVNLPLKRIESIRVHGYISSNGTLVPFPGGTSAPASRGQGAAAASPSAPPMVSFTGRKSDDQFDVVRVTLTAIVDERYLLKLVDSVSRTNFYQMVGVEYKTVDSVDPAGYFYGDVPVVEAVLDFEGYMARKIYKAMMPEEVLQALGIAKADAGKEAGKDAAKGAPKKK